MDIQYIPAVRTAEFAQGIVDELVRQELAKVEQDPKYIQALADVAAIQAPVLQNLSQNIATTMREFLPNMTQVKILIEDNERSSALRQISEFLLNDGAETPLSSKGDGVQSLAALALMRHASQSADEGKDFVIALEEPESHLHPSAIRQLRKVLLELSTRYQVVITTHNPLFTNRVDIRQNIIVKQSRAYPARTVKEVRDVLGVQLSDNLSSAETILIVEGEDDRIAVGAILSTMDRTLSKSIESGRLGIDVLGGANNLAHRVRLHAEALCQVHTLLDYDVAGRAAFKAAERDGLLTTSGINFTQVAGKTEAELEDLYDESVYAEIIRGETGLEWLSRGPDASKKWTDRLRNLLRRAGKPNDDGTLRIIKIKVAQSAAMRGVEALHPNKITPIESLKNSLLSKLSTQT